MKFSLIICTYRRPGPLMKLLYSVQAQSLAPNEVIVVDGSPDNETERAIKKVSMKGLFYHKVGKPDRGLTRQRNFGISNVRADNDIICFLDDDIVLKEDYFEQLIRTYSICPGAIGVAGKIISDIKWKKRPAQYGEFYFDGYSRILGWRNVLRKRLGLLSDQPPGVMPEFSHGLSTGFLPPTGKIYAVEFFMGGTASYRKQLFQEIRFSPYFEGYGLYEDMDFCLRAGKFGQLYVNTAAQLYHYHENSGRPGKYDYGKMVVRNGWYVWRVKYPIPRLKARLKWHITCLLLIFIRMTNVLTTNSAKRKEAFTESLGRIVGWGSLFLKRPNNEF